VHKPGTKIFHGMHCIPDKCRAECWLYKDIITEHPTPLSPTTYAVRNKNVQKKFVPEGLDSSITLVTSINSLIQRLFTLYLQYIQSIYSFQQDTKAK